MFTKQYVRGLSLASMASMLLGCAATYQGDGIVMEEHQVGQQLDRKVQIKQHAKVGGATGAIVLGSTGGIFGGVPAAIGGGVVGAVLGSAAGGLYGVAEGGSSNPTLFASVIGAGTGAVAFGLPGAAVGGAAGYLMTKHLADYQYIVKSLRDNKLYTVTQYSARIPLHTQVRVLERNGSLFIRKVGS